MRVCMLHIYIYISHVPKEALVPLAKRPALSLPFTMDEVGLLSTIMFVNTNI